MKLVRSIFVLATVLWAWIFASAMNGSMATKLNNTSLANASHMSPKKPKAPRADPDRLHAEVADLALERIASARVDVQGHLIHFNLFVDDQTRFDSEGPFSREGLVDTISETLHDSTLLALENADLEGAGKRGLRRGRPLQIVLVDPKAANREGRFGDWQSPYVEGLCGTKKKGVASSKKPSSFEGMFLWPHLDTHAHTLIAVKNWDSAMVTLAHEVTHYWYSRLGMRSWWQVPSDAHERIPEKTCAAKHLAYFRENEKPVDAYWRNQIFAELTEEAFAHDH